MPEQDGNIAQAVLAAIGDGEIEVHYQPQMTADGEHMVGV
jgi:EAL domain-containing protein (putative c-di-GMP-specific phosphodiesterase class I)